MQNLIPDSDRVHILIIAGAVSSVMSHQNNNVAVPKQAIPTQKGKENHCSPTNSSRNSSDNEDDIYTVPGPVKTTALPTQTSDVTYYNYPVRDHQPLSGSENSKALLVTGSSKIAKPGPITKPKPLKGKSHITGEYILSIHCQVQCTPTLIHFSY